MALVAGATLASAAIFALVPAIDLTVSAASYAGGGFWAGSHPVLNGIRRAISLLAFGTVAVVGLSVVLRRAGWRPIVTLPERRAAAVLLTFALGPLAGAPLLKRVFDRPRPAQVTQFGGDEVFVPLLRHGPGHPDGCNSFPSGEVATGFAFVAVGLALGSPLVIAASGALGVAVAAARVLQGRHFLSDVVVTACLVILLALVLHRRTGDEMPG